MIHGYILTFFLLSGIFAMTHYVAMQASLYWYFWWFDSVMHFWGGCLIGLGVHALATFPHSHIRPTYRLMLFTLFVATVSWEIFEWHYGIADTRNYVFDTTKDIFLGFSGGLLAHTILWRRIQ